MKLLILLVLVALGSVMVVGCGPRKAEKPDYEGPAVAAGDVQKVVIGVAGSDLADPRAATLAAAQEAIKACGGQAKGLVVYEDTADTAAVIAALESLDGDIPYIGCHAEGQATDKTYKGGVTVMAIGGSEVKVATAVAPLLDKREETAKQLVDQLAGKIEDPKVIFLYSEPTLSFGAGEGVTTVVHFLQGMKAGFPDAMMFGGNCKPNRGQENANEFIAGKSYKDYAVAMAVSGPFDVIGEHQTEFEPVGKPVTVTKADWADDGKWWIIELDGKPAQQVYREMAGMDQDDEFTYDSEHAIGVVVTPDRRFLRMVLELGDNGAFKTISEVPVGQQVNILKFPGKIETIYASANASVKDMLGRAGWRKPLAVLSSDCCARGSRVAEWSEEKGDEVPSAIIPALGDTGVPYFGFYAWGEIGPIRGPFKGLDYMYQQHTFVGMLLVED